MISLAFWNNLNVLIHYLLGFTPIFLPSLKKLINLVGKVRHICTSNKVENTLNERGLYKFLIQIRRSHSFPG